MSRIGQRSDPSRLNQCWRLSLQISKPELNQSSESMIWSDSLMLSGWSVTIHWEASFWSVWEQISLFICDAEEQMGFHQLPRKKQLLRLIMCRCVARYTCLSLSELEITGVSLAQRRIINLLHFSTKPHACSFTHACWADE